MRAAGQVCNALHGFKPALLMVLVQITFAGVNVFYKLAANNGMNLKIIVAYRFVFATAFMVPMALILERKNRPKLTKMVLFQAFLCGLFGGSLAQNLYLGSMVLTSATFTCAMVNLGPAVTFIMAITFGLERLGLKSHAGQAKVAGTILGIGGAMLLTFYKGPEVDMWSTHVDLLKHGDSHAPQMASSHPLRGSHALGSLLAISSCFSYAFWLIIQAKMSERYPCPYSSTALMSLMGSIQSIIYAICTERKWDQWKLGWNIRLLTVAYSGIAASGLMVTLISWCVRMRGPLFVSVFSPLMLVMVAIAASLLLNETLHLGSIIGAALIVGGLYVVLWGKGKELKKMNQLTPLNCSSIQIVITSPAHNHSAINNTNKDQLADEVLQQHKNEIVSIESHDSDTNKGQDDRVIVSTGNRGSV